MHFFNLRNKILSFGLIILILVTSFNLYYTYNVFEEDKESYIFENVLRSTELIDRELGKLISQPDKVKLQLKTQAFSEVKSLMESDKIFSYVIKHKDKIIFGEDNLFNKTEITSSSHQAMVKEISFNEAKYLAGIVTNKTNGITTIAYINKSKAFASLDYLIKKNIYFAIILFGIVLILTIFFARSITTPILQIIQRTVDISNGDYDNKVVVKTNDELRILGDSVNTMSHEIKTLLDQKQEMIVKLEEANKQLDIYSKDLEKLVDERTKDLKDANSYITAMLNSLSQGLFVIRPDGTCSDLYTNSCLSIFGNSPENKRFAEYIKSENDSATQKWLELTFAQKMPFESCAPLGPDNFQQGSLGDENFKYINFDYYPLMLDETLSGIVVLATDFTEKLVLEENIKRKEAYINNVTEYVLNEEIIKNLVSEANSLLDEIIDSPASDSFCDRALMVFHTLNGGFGTYSFSDIQQYAIECEEFIQSNESNPQVVNDIKIRAASAKDLINESINELDEKFSNHNIISFEKDDIDYLSRSLSSLGSEGKEVLENFLHKKSISSIFNPYPKLVEKISQSLGKPMKDLIIPQSDFRIAPEKVQELSNSLVHVFKNSMDHGIEPIDRRSELGKEEKGEIKIDIQTNNDQIKILISDDGAGLNTEAIKEKLLQNYESDEIEKLSEQDLMAKIFDPNFSTRDSVSEFSGRGIGMSAVKEAIEKLNGSIHVDSKKGHGTRFEFNLKV